MAWVGRMGARAGLSEGQGGVLDGRGPGVSLDVLRWAGVIPAGRLRVGWATCTGAWPVWTSGGRKVSGLVP